MLEAVAIDVQKIFVGNAAQLSAQLAGRADGVELGPVPHDRLNGVDMMLDQLGGHLLEIRGVLDDPAQAVGGRSGGGVSESGGIAPDVMGGTKQLLAGGLGEA